MWWSEAQCTWEEGSPESLAYAQALDLISIHDIPSSHGVKLEDSVSNNIRTFLQS